MHACVGALHTWRANIHPELAMLVLKDTLLVTVRRKRAVLVPVVDRSRASIAVHVLWRSIDPTHRTASSRKSLMKLFSKKIDLLVKLSCAKQGRSTSTRIQSGFGSLEPSRRRRRLRRPSYRSLQLATATQEDGGARRVRALSI